MAKSTGRDEMNARLIHRFLTRHLRSTKEAICTGIGIPEAHFNAAVRFSRRCTDPAILANEIITVTKSAPFLYGLASRDTDDEYEAYQGKRSRTTQGHLVSQIVLAEKRALQVPERAKERELETIALKHALDYVRTVG